MDSTIRNFRIVQIEGKRQVERGIDFYNLDAISYDDGRLGETFKSIFRNG